VRAGQTVLDIGCGTGATLQALRDAIGSDGRVVGVDYSPRMIARARNRVRHHGWTSVKIRQADATRTTHGHAEFDAAVALASFSAMPDVRAAIDNAHDARRLRHHDYRRDGYQNNRSIRITTSTHCATGRT
jgi:ubiquinone/menaquinone biosynthesis C-methylase UbiE